MRVLHHRRAGNMLVLHHMRAGNMLVLHHMRAGNALPPVLPFRVTSYANSKLFDRQAQINFLIMKLLIVTGLLVRH